MRLALALIPDPLVVFLDEPTAGMDPSARLEFWKVMEGAAGRGRTIVFATHYLAEAEAFAARTIIMRRGTVAADAPTSTLMKRGLATLTINMLKSGYNTIRPRLDNSDWQSEWNEGVLTVHGQDLDDVARVALGVPEANGLRIADASLEEVFTQVALEDPLGDGREDPM